MLTDLELKEAEKLAQWLEESGRERYAKLVRYLAQEYELAQQLAITSNSIDFKEAWAKMMGKWPGELSPSEMVEQARLSQMEAMFKQAEKERFDRIHAGRRRMAEPEEGDDD